MNIKLCHGVSGLSERSSRKYGVRLFTCSCGKKWAWTEAAGYYQQGRPKIAEPKLRKSVVMSVRATEEQADAIRNGRAKFVYLHNPERHE